MLCSDGPTVMLMTIQHKFLIQGMQEIEKITPEVCLNMYLFVVDKAKVF